MPMQEPPGGGAIEESLTLIIEWKKQKVPFSSAQKNSEIVPTRIICQIGDRSATAAPLSRHTMMLGHAARSAMPFCCWLILRTQGGGGGRGHPAAAAARNTRCESVPQMQGSCVRVRHGQGEAQVKFRKGERI